MVRLVKRESMSSEVTEMGKGVNLELNNTGMSGQGAIERRILRSRYLAVKNLISNERDDISRQDSKKFKSIIDEVEALHENVKRPREQVADAETLLDITSTLATSVRSQNNEGVTPSDFVTAILNNFGNQQHSLQVDNSQNMVSWENIGFSVSDIFKTVPGCCTMIGPMSNEMKQRKVAVYKKRTKPTESTCPEEIQCIEQETKTDTDSNMLMMFEILKKKKRVRLECLLLNWLSFAQTVENIFALSFLVKDGRAEITVDDKGCHFVSPKNAPKASAVSSGNVSYHHFVFRFDFKDWKSMMQIVGRGEELMPHRSPSNNATSSSIEKHSTPIRKLTRNRGLITVDEDSIVQDSIEKDLIPLKKPIPGKKLRL